MPVPCHRHLSVHPNMDILHAHHKSAGGLKLSLIAVTSLTSIWTATSVAFDWLTILLRYLRNDSGLAIETTYLPDQSNNRSLP